MLQESLKSVCSITCTFGPDPDEIKCLLEDALVLLGNANVRLNQWRQKQFSEYLTEVGRCTLKAGIPTDKHLSPDQFHKMIQSEHEHSGRNSKLIATPSKPSTANTTGSKSPFDLLLKMAQTDGPGENEDGPPNWDSTTKVQQDTIRKNPPPCDETANHS